MIAELDGAAHDGREDYDARRTQILELFGYIVVRVRNERILADPGATADDILAVLRAERVKPLTLPPLRGGPLPLSKREGYRRSATGRNSPGTPCRKPDVQNVRPRGGNNARDGTPIRPGYQPPNSFSR